MHWRDRAACRDSETDYWFPPDVTTKGMEPGREQREAAAKAICARCPVRDACLASALANREPVGVWGAKTEAEREGILRARCARERVA